MPADSQDAREHQALTRGLAELGYDPGQYHVEVTPLPPDRNHAVPIGRKRIVVRHVEGATFQHETYVGGAWAGEILQAVISRAQIG